MADPVRAIRALAGLADDAPRVIHAYHGSPYSFSRFDASRIGTGEGAQAYGHGLYFAGNEGVARSYRDIVGQEELTRHQEELRGLLGRKSAAAMALQEAEIGYKNAVRNKHITGKTQEQIDQEWSARIADARAAMNQSHLAALSAAPRRQRGHMYEVEIGYPEDLLLDWDSGITNQFPAVDEALQRMRGSLPLRQRNVLSRGRKAADAYTDLSLEVGREEAARLLSDSGIPGIRYLDAGSRSAGDGTRNYVMFPGTEDRIRILRQYGWMLPFIMAAGTQATPSAVEGR